MFSVCFENMAQFLTVNMRIYLSNQQSEPFSPFHVWVPTFINNDTASKISTHITDLYLVFKMTLRYDNGKAVQNAITVECMIINCFQLEQLSKMPLPVNVPCNLANRR